MEGDAEERLKLRLEKINWPEPYMFKFIFKLSSKTEEELNAVFDNGAARIDIRPSSKGNYVSYTAVELMLSADGVLQRYRSIQHIKGIMSL